MRLVSKILRWRYEHELDRQAPMAAEIYDKIIMRVPPKDILASLRRPISKEIRSILRALHYIPPLPPLKQPTVSVIIPHFNQHACLKEALRGIAQQTVPPDEVIVVDDQSERFDEVQRIGQEFSVKLIRPPGKLYTGKARETGALAATGNIIIMHDADDLSHPNRVEFTRKTFMEFPDALQVNVGLVTFTNFSGYIRNFDWKEARPRIRGLHDIAARMKTIFTEQRFTISEKKFRARRGWYGAQSDFGAHDGNVAFRKEALDYVHYSAFGNYIFTKWVDYEFNMMLFLAGARSYQIDLPLLYFRHGSSSFISGT